jgi:hypothetical protein
MVARSSNCSSAAVQQSGAWCGPSVVSVCVRLRAKEVTTDEFARWYSIHGGWRVRVLNVCATVCSIHLSALHV